MDRPVLRGRHRAIDGTIGADRILLGSDWPHPEGTTTPVEWIDDIAGFSPADTRKIMRDNLRGAHPALTSK